MSIGQSTATNFEVIEGEKENILPLRLGRSASALSKTIIDKATPPGDYSSKVSNISAKRLEFEERLLQELEDLDDPLELFLEYLTWINNAYPQGGQTKQSGMLELLERCLMYFRDFKSYKNDPRYVRIWMWYLELFTGSNQEKESLYVYMTRKQIGEGLTMFYESLADWLKQQQEHSQARDVLLRGIENNARPLGRLRRKLNLFDEFLSNSNIEILAVKSGESILEQDIYEGVILGQELSRIHNNTEAPLLFPSSSLKHPIFRDGSEADEDHGLRKFGWDVLDSKLHRDKENEVRKHPIEAGINAGALLQNEPIGKSADRVPIFKDSIGRTGPIYKILEMPGRKPEKVDCNFELIYPENGEEFSIEELLAISRNVYHRKLHRKRHEGLGLEGELSLSKKPKIALQEIALPALPSPAHPRSNSSNVSQNDDDVQDYQKVEKTSVLPLKDEATGQHTAARRSGPSSPTVTFFSKDAMEEVYSMFNQNYSAPQQTIENDDTTSRFAMFENFTQDFTRKTCDDLTEVRTTNSQDQVHKTPHKELESDLNSKPQKGSTTPSYKSKLQEYMTPIQERTEASFNVRVDSLQTDGNTNEDKKGGQALSYTAESSPFLTQPQSLDEQPLIISKPLSDESRMAQLKTLNPPLSAYPTFYQYNQCLKMSSLLRRIHTVSKNANKNPIVDFKKTNDLYCIRSQLGEGGYATVYLAESSTGALKALKVEKPASIWEFYILKQIQKRLGGQPVLNSIINVDSMHCFQDESYLVLNYASQGTILDLINLERERSGGTLDEILCMYFAVELMKVLECIHDVGIIHGDLKPDNCMIRFEDDLQPLSDYDANGENGWYRKGLYLIDFGRSFDLTLVPSGTKFKANWSTDQQDCPEMREGRPWTYEADYYGLAGIIHAILFGKFIETRALPNRQYALANNFKRYWRHDIWEPLFKMLLNSGENEVLPITSNMREHRMKLEEILMEQGHKLNVKISSLQTDLYKFKG
ncbi:LADA_0D11254g1_1 [Lachancea dasiensis]|uniref:LADA_0D11254g1_1 n=1 Tax=Lachancea dasiensis TaxID=1072105 RepID=A0A1G4J7R1_9SACH|nr:LADA_0D11254g1_1 [Lachancea dasiensis]